METVDEDRCVVLLFVLTVERFTELPFDTVPDFTVLVAPRLTAELCGVLPEEVVSLPETLVLWPEVELVVFLPDSIVADLRVTVPWVEGLPDIAPLDTPVAELLSALVLRVSTERLFPDID